MEAQFHEPLYNEIPCVINNELEVNGIQLQILFYSKTQQNPQLSCHFYLWLYHKRHISVVYWRNRSFGMLGEHKKSLKILSW